LFVGTFPRSTEDIDRLHQQGVTAVLNVQTDEDMAYWGVNWNRLERQHRQVGIEVRRVPVRDFDLDDLRRQLPECVEVLEELLQSGYIAYVYCNMGINRSPSIVIAYLHWVQGWDLENATDNVMKCRSCEPYLDAIGLAGEDRKREK
jgi:protein-tyrosine phosphatase